MSLNNDACDGKIIYFVNIWSEFEQEQKNSFLKINHCRLIADENEHWFAQDM